MNKLRFSARLFCGCLLLLICSNFAIAQEVKLEGVPFQQVLDRLFGTTSTPGLLGANQHFELRAEDVTLTRAQAQSFFVPSSANTADIADLVTAAEQVKGTVKIEGLVDGAPFELKVSGREVKLEGVSFTTAQLDSLIGQLKGISGLREAKIESIVDGRPMEVKIENKAGIMKVEDRERHNTPGHVHDADNDHEQSASSQNRGSGPSASFDRPEKMDKVEHIERPEIEHGGPGHH
jgi:hypothetical protein